MSENNGNLFALDTSAILTLWNDEAGANEVEDILKGKDNTVIVSFMSFMECYYRNWKNLGREKGREIYAYLFTLPIERVDLSEDILQSAVEIKATYTLSVADSWIIATAKVQDAVLVHKDPEFMQISDLIELQNLPFK